MSMNASEKHEQNVVDSLNAMRSMLSDLESSLKNSEISQRDFNGYMKGQNDKIEIDFARLFDLQKGFRFALGSEVFKRAHALYYLYGLYYDALGRPTDVYEKQLDDLKATILSKTRKIQSYVGEEQLRQENTRKDKFTRIVDRVTDEVHGLKNKFLGWPIRRKVAGQESEFNVNYKKAQEEHGQVQQDGNGGTPQE
jgi:hypothetical protein